QIMGISGETDLKRTAIYNADLRYEYYPKSGALISFGLLAKRFDNPIELRMDPGSNGDRWLFKYSNAERAMLYGAEVEIRKDLGFISESLADLTFIGNATVLDSKVTLVTEGAGGKKIDEDRPLFGQSPWLISAGFQSANTGWQTTPLYTGSGPRLIVGGDRNGQHSFGADLRPRDVI